jgi:hypothetical protein
MMELATSGTPDVVGTVEDARVAGSTRRNAPVLFDTEKGET